MTVGRIRPLSRTCHAIQGDIAEIGRRVQRFLSRPTGCWSQGANEAEALENIRSAIQEYLGVVEEILREAPEIEVRELDVAV